MRKVKKQVAAFLENDDFKKNLSNIHQLPAQHTINALISFLCTVDPIKKKRAISALGEIVTKIAEEDIESARGIMRRLAWSLNEESGWIGWGSAEAMGEIMARNSILAEEYHKLLISYISVGDNYLLFEELRKEVVLGLKRLSKAHPQLVSKISHLLN